jgi:rfaE bifunctional protein kinase chain/domain/rfaE bifunctional protein nucleotidyltransferase chain/domain
MYTYPKSLTDKIKSVESLKKMLEKKPDKTVVMCHGTFDIVHPGHIRHLIYAKQQGDLLIASCTADKYIEKGKDKPFIPEELRARNLAALEMVDYIIIDQNKTPVENILLIKPNLFVKGFEYSKDGIHPKTKEEIQAVLSYGGKVVFSPGDYVQSSTHLLTIKKPKLSIEKLIAIMDSEGITFNEVLDTIDKFKGIKVHVVGDTIIDRYTFCSVLGPTTKTPTFSIKKESQETYLGAAAVVAKHLKSLGADVTFTTIMGDDENREFAQNDLDEWGVKQNVIIDPSRPTTLKERFWADGYKLLQVDTVDSSRISDKITEKLAKALIETDTEAVIFSDFRHGIFNLNSVKIFTECLPGNIIKIADSQVSNRWGNILDFKNFDIIIPNEKEARFALADQDSGVRPLGTDLYRKSKADYLILKLGEKGIMVFRDSAYNPRDFFSIESFAENLIDGVGAGDSLLAATTLAYVKSKNIVISSILGNIAAAVACETEGNIPVSPEQIKDIIDRIRSSSLV